MVEDTEVGGVVKGVVEETLPVLAQMALRKQAASVHTLTNETLSVLNVTCMGTMLMSVRRKKWAICLLYTSDAADE